MSVRILTGDCRDVLKTLPDESVHSVTTDPPYHLTSIVKRFGKADSAPAKSNGATGVYARAAKGFMGQTWDGGGVAFEPETWAAVARVLKPGGYLLAFGAPRNYHRLACAIEDAGFEVRDCLMWLFGSGFPKSHNLEGEWEGWGTALKPAYEPIIMARKPLIGTVAENVMKHGTGAINIGATRVGMDGEVVRTVQGGKDGGGFDIGSSDESRRDTFESHLLGRWPANVVHDGSGEVLAAFPDAPGQQGAPTGNEPSATFSGAIYGKMARTEASTPRGDSGSAARFFYNAKATAEDRAGSKHPTLKPLALMRWLVRMVTPKGGTVLDPFAGTGTTGQAADEEGFNAILIELDPVHVETGKQRIRDSAGLFAEVA